MFCSIATDGVIDLFGLTVFAPGTPIGRNPFQQENASFREGNYFWSQSCSMNVMSSMRITRILEATRPPDPELVDLIERAFFEGQIDSQKAELAYLWLSVKKA